MKINKRKVLYTSILFLVSGIVFLFGPEISSWNAEFAIFEFKVSLVLFALYSCTDTVSKKQIVL